MINLRNVVMAQAEERLNVLEDDIQSILQDHPLDIDAMRNLNECLALQRQLRSFVAAFPTGQNYDRSLALELMEQRLEMEELHDDLA